MLHRSPSSLLADEWNGDQPNLSRPDIVAVSPSTLLPDDDYRRKRLASQDSLPQRAPSSLLSGDDRALSTGAGQPDVAAVSPSSLLADEGDRRRRLAVEDQLPPQAPSSLLADARNEHARAPRQPDVAAVSPSSLVPPEDDRRRRLAEPEQLPQKTPSSLLPESAFVPSRARLGPELVAVSPSDLLASDAPARALWTNRRIAFLALCAVVAACLFVVLAARFDASRLLPSPVKDAQPPAGQAELVRLGPIGPSIEALQERAGRVPHDPAPRYALGQAHYSNGHFQRAEAEFRKALDLGFDRPRGTAALASSLLLQREFEKVLDEGQPNPDWPADIVAELTALRGLAVLGLARIADAERLFDDVLKTHPQQTLALFGKARIAASRNNAEEAKRFSELESQHGGSSPEALSMRAQLRWVLDKADDARGAAGSGAPSNAASQARD